MKKSNKEEAKIRAEIIMSLKEGYKQKMKKTAVEWLHYVSKQRELDKFDWEQAKEMEKKQIKNAWLNSLTKGDYNSADEYYNENYKNEPK